MPPASIMGFRLTYKPKLWLVTGGNRKNQKSIYILYF